VKLAAEQRQQGPVLRVLRQPHLPLSCSLLVQLPAEHYPAARIPLPPRSLGLGCARAPATAAPPIPSFHTTDHPPSCRPDTIPGSQPVSLHKPRFPPSFTNFTKPLTTQQQHRLPTPL
jgi:hypothetical protein